MMSFEILLSRMCGVRSPLFGAVLAGAAVVPVGLALAQANTDGASFGGSFETGAPPAQTLPAAPAPAAAPADGGNFGGSFDEGGAPPPGPVAAAPPPPAPPPPPTGTQPQPVTPPAPAAVGGGDFGSGGAFDPAPGGGTVEPGTGSVATDPGTGGGAPPAPSGAGAEIAAFETRDFGVPPTNSLRPGQFHSPTPTAIPGAQVVTTDALAQAMNSGTRMVLIDVLGGEYSLPNALMAGALSSPGTLDDRLQQQATQWLGQVTGGDRSIPVVVFCSDPMCWLSYNGTLRVVAAGYTNVYWYRGGLQAWQMSGLPLYPSSF